MRPVHLTMQAFGPYADEQVVDFRELGDRDVFLIHGPTGGGKSTILDGICFALYGKTSGGRDARALRSDHASADTLTRISLVFRLCDEVYRIERVPEQERPTKRRTGTTKQQPTAVLYQLNSDDELDGGTLIYEGVRDVDVEVQELLGLSVDQFRQVVLLPQNRFAEFLQSKAADREKIFQTLFNTSRFQRLTQRLKEMKGEVEQELVGLHTRRDALLDQVGVEDEQSLQDSISTVAGELKQRTGEQREAEKALDREQQALSRGQDDQRKLDARDKAVVDLEALEQKEPSIAIQRELVEKANRAEKVSPWVEAARKSEAKRVEAESDAHSAATEKETADKAVADLEAHIPQHERNKTQLAAAERAQHVQPHVQHRDERAAALETAKDQRQNAREELVKAEQAFTDAEEAWKREQGRQDERERANQTAIRLKQQMETVSKAVGMAETIDEKAGDHDNLVQSAEDSAQAVEKARRNLKDAEEERERLEPMAEALGTQSAEIEKLESTLGLRRELDSARENQERCEADAAGKSALLKTANKQLELAERTQAELEASWRRSQAARLAQSLTDDEPCPVCGSVHHPDPAQEADVVGDDAVEEACKTVRDSREHREEIHQHQQTAIADRDAARKEVKRLIRELGDSADQEVNEKLQNVRSQEKRALQAKVQRAKLAEALPGMRKAVEKAESQEKSLQQELTILETELEALQKQQKELLADIPAELRDLSAIEDALEEAHGLVKELADALEKARNKRVETSEAKTGAERDVTNTAASVKTAKAQLESSSATVVEHLEKQGFADEDEYLSAVLDDEDREALQTEINEFVQELGTAREAVKNAASNLKHAKSAAKSAQKQASDEAERRDKELTKHEFISLSEWSDARRNEEEIAELQEGIKQFDEDFAAGRDRKKTTEAEADGIQKPDLDAVESLVQEAKTTLKDATEATGEVRERHSALKKIQTSIAQITEQAGDSEKRFNTISVLADTAAGRIHGQQGRTLHRYVLGFMLEQVLATANVHLEVLSQGRFSLHRDEAQERSRDGGLGILVYDAWTSERRVADTLSGGETFLASLALALGLAETVQQQAGAIALDTIFIDEGFGSLDQETVDHATESLFKLRSQGRLLGVISHVETMRQQIPTCLQVIKTPRGSRAEFVLDD